MEKAEFKEFQKIEEEELKTKPHFVVKDDKAAAVVQTTETVEKSNALISNKYDGSSKPEEQEKQGQEEQTSEPPITITATDIVAIVWICIVFFISQLLDCLPGGSIEVVHHFYAVILGIAMLGSLGYFQSLWFADLLARVRKIKGGQQKHVWIDKINCINPALLAVILYAINGTLFLTFGSVVGKASGLIAVFLIAFIIRWLVLIFKLQFDAIKIANKGVQKYKNAIKIVSPLTSLMFFLPAIVMCSFKDSYDAIPSVYITFMATGLVFACLRNLLIKSDTASYIAPISPTETISVPGDPSEISIAYNHFVELQKWFKQKFALRSPWKLGVLVFILLAAVVSNLHVQVLNMITAAVASFGAHIPGAISAADANAENSKLSANAIANSGLVIFFGYSCLVLAVFSFWIYVRAPKRLVITKKGLTLKFLPIRKREDKQVTWSSISRIKIERPLGRTSAAGDLLVFERNRDEAIRLKLGGIASANDREKLLAAIDRYAPEINRDAAVEETLRKPSEHNYTELWLQALAAPPKRGKTQTAD